jgi:thiol-disulfide isomerase/thioredoxin
MLSKVAAAIFLALVLGGLFTGNGLAYEAETGVRAANFRGFDIVGQQTIELDDYLGQWIYLEFWATWCGPCMRDLPKMLEATRPYVDSGQLKVITVNADQAEQLPEVKRVLRELRIDYPVIYDGGAYDETWGFPLPAVEWDVHSFPSTFLINPHGEIVANYMWGKDLRQLLDFYLTGVRRVMGVNGYATVHEDGTSVSVFANVMNRDHSDVNLRLSAHLSRLMWDEDNVVYDSKDIAITPVSMTATVGFDAYSESVHEFVISTDENWHSLSFSLFLSVPGAEHIVNHSGLSYELLYTGDEYLLIELERVNGQWVVVGE